MTETLMRKVRKVEKKKVRINLAEREKGALFLLLAFAQNLT